MLETVAPSTNLSQTKSVKEVFPQTDVFLNRHIGPDAAETDAILKVLGAQSLDQFIEQAVPLPLRRKDTMDLPEAATEFNVLAMLKNIAAQNQVYRSYIGMGYYDTITPPVVQRNMLENPGWYTPYTPYQAEASQGRLESLLNFQTMITELTAMDVANASLLDEGTAAAEAMAMCHEIKEGRTTFLVSKNCHPQTIDIVATRAKPLGIQVVVSDESEWQINEQVFGVLVQYPDTYGTINDYSALAEKVHAGGALLVVAADLLSLTLLKPPGEFGADVAVGSAQRFGVPLGYGGPHAGYFATKDEFKRRMPGRLIGVSKDAQGRAGLRLSLQAREQHIRREKATSNICTAQALLANMAAMYAIYHGPNGLKGIAERIRTMTSALAEGVKRLGFDVSPGNCFDTLRVGLGSKRAADVLKIADGYRINMRLVDSHTLGISLDETVLDADLLDLLKIFNGGTAPAFGLEDLATENPVPENLRRTSQYLKQPIFNQYHTETELLRYIRKLESRDISLTTTMIPLGSCTMKLNATSEMFPVSWPEFSKLHPFAPLTQTRGYQVVFRELEHWLEEITGFAGVSLQPNAGSQGELAGLLVINQYHESRGQKHRNICLIPTSAHGTNPASAVMAGMKVVPVLCDQHGNIDVDDLRAKATQYRDVLAACMITYPSTHGVFEERIREVCQIVHENGGQVYLDGANLNAMVGLCAPGDLGMDVCHVNLHKTFCIPHGGGGPGMGPIGVAEHLVEFLPGHPVVNLGGENPIGAISAAPWGSASILVISWVYICAMGGAGLTHATKMAILNANYIARRLDPYFPVLYRAKNGTVAHECIVDLRKFKSAGIEVEDVAKRLMDYHFHAPTVSFPVPGTLMIEPTESENKHELDRFCEAMIFIHKEIEDVVSGKADKQLNVLKGAPHTASLVSADKWERPYSREQAAFPAPWTREYKYWPPVARIDNVYGDRNLVCSCDGMAAYMEQPAKS